MMVVAERIEAVEQAKRAALSCNSSVKAGGIVPETVALLRGWDEHLGIEDNLDLAQRENRLGKDSRARSARILSVIQRRYLGDPQVVAALRRLIDTGWPRDALRCVLFFHTLTAEPLLAAIVTEVIAPLVARGQVQVASRQVVSAMRRWMHEGRAVQHWSEATVERAASGALATLRDFGLLEGAASKRVAPQNLPVPAFAYIAFMLYQQVASGQRILHHPIWQAFLLGPDAVERLLFEAHAERLLDYRAAGSVTRLEFPATTLEEYARDLAQRAH